MRKGKPDDRVVIVKFVTGGVRSHRRRLASVVGDDLVSAASLFPGTREPELQTHVVLRLGGKADVEAVLDRLRLDDDVEYAHVPPGRETS